MTAASVLSGCGASSSAESKEAVEKSMFVDTLNPQDESYSTFTTDYAAIFSPIKVGSLTLKNRIIKSAAGSDTHSSKPPLSQNSLDYFSNFAKGGAAVVLMDGGVMAPYGFNGLAGTIYKTYDEATAAAKVMSDAVHAGGAYVGIQMSTGSLGPSVTPLQVDSLTVEQIRALTARFAQQALAAKKAGFDIVEFKGAASDDMNAFLTRRLNKRKDEYGPQSIENRSRWMCEIIQAIKAACGKDFTVACLINVFEENDAQLGINDKFITVDESTEIAKLLEKAGADWIQLRCGTPGLESAVWGDMMHAGFRADGMTGYGTMFDYSCHFGGLQDGKHSGSGAFIPAVAKIRKAVKVPVGCAGSMDPRTAPDLINNAVRDGLTDLVFLNRPLTVDPELPNKLQAKKRDEVAPCTHCWHCHTAGITPKEPELCRVNAATQRAYTSALPEGYVLAPAKTVKNVMVIGGGPGGMEAARRAAQKGHKVTLYEKGSSLGGLVKTASGFKGSHERLEDLIAFLTKQQSLNKVTVVTGKEVDAAFVDTVKPDAIIVAVGGKRDAKFAGSSVTAPNVINIGSYDNSKIGSKVVILGAGAQAVDLVMYLLAQGKQVTMVHGDVAAKVDKEQSIHFRQYIPPHIQAKGVKIWSESTVQKIVDGGVVIKTAGVEMTLKCDTVVECWDMLANTTLADALKSKYTVSLVGDCANAGKDKNILYAIQAGYDAARAI
ncbi:MAG: FAD-dependent oxidoreductase [Coriobacteriia bacterium]|nr:FAD-dependent oxidoreductase [Coriobacteriia bacterium]